MNVTQQAMIALMKSAVLQEPQPLPEGFEIGEAMDLIRMHHIAALIYDGAVRCGVSRQDPAMAQLFRAYCGAMLYSEGQQQEIGRIFRAFEENGIDYLPLKGCNMKSLYPKPEMRTMGDADILIRLDQYPRIKTIMKSLGFEWVYETDHELVWKSPKLHVELHKRMIPSDNRGLYSYYGDGWQMAVPSCGSRWDLTPEDTFVYLFAHFAKHYRGGGIGCRYVLDLWVYLRAHPELRMDRVMAVLEKLGLREFYGNISRMMAVWFDGAPSDERTEWITDFIFDSGSWGNAKERAAAISARNMHRAGTVSGGKVRYLVSIVFPGIDMLQGEYPVLSKAPWLLPVIWVVRIFRRLFSGRPSRKRYKLVLGAMNPEAQDAHLQMLRYVGLDYHDDL